MACLHFSNSGSCLRWSASLPQWLIGIAPDLGVDIYTEISRGCTKSLLEPGCIDELFRPGKPFQKPIRGIFVQMGLRLQSKWLKKPIETQQWEMASLAFSYTL